MTIGPFVERHQADIAGVISCFDRVVITGTLPDIGHATAMAGYLGSHGVRLFDYPLWAQRAHSRFPGHALTPTGVMAIRCKQFHLPDL